MERGCDPARRGISRSTSKLYNVLNYFHPHGDAKLLRLVFDTAALR
jgi:hypothetical protein